MKKIILIGLCILLLGCSDSFDREIIGKGFKELEDSTGRIVEYSCNYGCSFYGLALDGNGTITPEIMVKIDLCHSQCILQKELYYEIMRS